MAITDVRPEHGDLSLRERRRRDDETGKGAREDAPTRSEILRSRGYPEEVINGNGSAAAASGSQVSRDLANASTPSRDQEQGDDSLAFASPSEFPTRTCQGCGTAINGQPSKVWCSEPCRRRARRSHAAPAQVAQETPEEVAATNGPSESQIRSATTDFKTLGSVSSHPAGTDRLAPIYAMLMLSGASVRLLEVTVEQETWRIERVAHTNGGTP
jgi:hypothetical protein